MRGLGELIATLRTLGEPAALATLVGARGSSYRLPGARMIFRPGGDQTGGISAGCLEADVKERAAEVIAQAIPIHLSFDMGNDLDLVWGTGMGCQGKAEVFLERVGPGLPPWMELCGRLLQERQPGVMGTVFAARGSVPAHPGDHFVQAGGRDLLPLPVGLAAELHPAMARVLGSGLAETCHFRFAEGGLSVLVEPLVPPIALWVYGAGEHARPIFRLAKELGWSLGLVDHRPALATAVRFPQADRIVVGHPPDSLVEIPLDARSAALVVSHAYEPDKAAVAALLETPLGYFGIQGNRKRSERILREIEQETGPLSEAARARLHYPAGLDIGAESPEAIALSMLSEIQAVLSGHDGSPLRHRQGAIHGRQGG